MNRIQPRAEDEIHRLLAQGHNLTEFFSGHHWSIHPDWLYCKSKYKTYESPEKELKDILKAVSQPWWKWPLNRSPPSPEHTANFYCKCMDIFACWFVTLSVGYRNRMLYHFIIMIIIFITIGCMSCFCHRRQNVRGGEYCVAVLLICPTIRRKD